jgi:hypothetical protein
MITQGSDGLSRGNLSEGVMRGEEMTSFIPLHLSALERSEALKVWIASWFSLNDRPLEFLEPIDWYERGHDIKGSTKSFDGQWLPEYVAGCYILNMVSSARSCIHSVRGIAKCSSEETGFSPPVRLPKTDVSLLATPSLPSGRFDH